MPWEHLMKATLSSPNLSLSSTRVFSPTSVFTSDRQTWQDNAESAKHLFDSKWFQIAYARHLGPSTKESDRKCFPEALSRARDDRHLPLHPVRDKGGVETWHRICLDLEDRLTVKLLLYENKRRQTRLVDLTKALLKLNYLVWLKWQTQSETTVLKESECPILKKHIALLASML